MQETKHARLRERTQIIYYITGLGVTQCRWMNVTLKTINARTSAAQAHLTHAHQNKNHTILTQIVKTDESEYQIFSYFRKQVNHELISTKNPFIKKGVM